MPLTCHSEHHPLRSVFLNEVTAAFLSEAKLEKEWKSLNYLAKPNLNTAKTEYDNFKTLLTNEGVEIHYLQTDQSLSIDSIYCRDASIATDHGMIICSMGKRGRLQEPFAHRASFEACNISVLGAITPPGTLEGGDVAWLNTTTLAVGHSYRTNEEGIRQLEQLLAPFGINLLVAVLPHYKGPADVFHLMSIFSPVDKDMAVVYSPLMPIGFRNELLHSGYHLIEVPDNEFETMGCNVLATGPGKCIMVSGNPKTEQALRKVGCVVHTYEGREISTKGGGGPTCLTRPVHRQF